ncbi:hypothetical protein GQ53DRAFT_742703 [Thozetella sp. PMI_491]|nr:hypothetical protein GQ53DRAFT_742703 [Thozetella sp. PMI_491]
MEDTLVNELRSLGTDKELRKANLLHLISSLPPQEIRDVRDHLATISLQRDFVPELPVELRAIVASYIEPEDIYPILNVSKRWRVAWTSDHVLHRLANRAFPGFIEHAQLKEQMTSEPEDLAERLYRTARRCHFRTKGKFRSWFRWDGGDRTNDAGYHWDDKLHRTTDLGKPVDWSDFLEEGADSLFILDRNDLDDATAHYSDGIVAWQPACAEPKGSVVVVDNLRTRARKVYTSPDRDRLVLQGGGVSFGGVGDTLIVVALGRSLCAWNHHTDEMERITLPYSPNLIRTRKKRVYITGFEPGQVSSWEFGGPLRSLDLSHLGRAPVTTDFLFHPLLDDVVFTVFYDRKGVLIGQLNEKAPRQTFRLDWTRLPSCIGPPNPGFGRWGPKIRAGCNPSNAFGENVVCIISSESCVDCEATTHKGAAGRHAVAVCFNVLNSQFSLQNYYLPSIPASKTAAVTLSLLGSVPSFWYDRAVVVAQNDWEFSGGGDMLALLTLHESDPSTRYTGPQEGWRHILPGLLPPGPAMSESDWRKDGNAFEYATKNWDAWVQTVASHLQSSAVLRSWRNQNCSSAIVQSSRVYQDDEFIVAICLEGYWVWRFDED